MDSKWHKFLDIGVKQGAQVALQWSEKSRPVFLSCLHSVCCPWWDTGAVWKSARKASYPPSLKNERLSADLLTLACFAVSTTHPWRFGQHLPLVR